MLTLHAGGLVHAQRVAAVHLIAPRVELCPPVDVALRVYQGQRRAQMVAAVQMHHRRRGFRHRLQQRQQARRRQLRGRQQLPALFAQLARAQVLLQTVYPHGDLRREDDVRVLLKPRHQRRYRLADAARHAQQRHEAARLIQRVDALAVAL
ncbi:hypothetical protein D3C80_1289230 [compost metagenome]